MKLKSLSKQREYLQEEIALAKDEKYKEGFKEGIEKSFKQFEETIQLYKKYRNNIKLLMEEQNKIWKKWIEYYEKQSNIKKEDFLQKYNDWLFSYLFEETPWKKI